MNPRLVAVGVAVSLSGGLGMLGVRHLDDSRPVSVDTAVERFREATPVPSASASATPRASAAPGATAAPGTAPRPGHPVAPTTGPTSIAVSRSPEPGEEFRTPDGVYVYKTTGYETADAGVPKARHDYPAETTVTIRDNPCGIDVRWDGTEDRWDGIAICLHDSYTKVASYTSFHRFFGQSQRHDYTCGGTSYLRPPTITAGYTWSFDCTTSDAKAHTVGTVVGYEMVGTTRALHIHYDSTLTGSQRGENPQDFWIAGPYVVRQASRVDAEVDTPFGTITYHEEYDLVLKSRTPRR